MASDRTFKKEDIEDLKLLLQLGKRVAEKKIGHLKSVILQNIQEVIDPNLRLGGRIRAKYDGLRQAGFDHEEAVEYTAKSVSRTIELVLGSLKKTEDK